MAQQTPSPDKIPALEQSLPDHTSPAAPSAQLVPTIEVRAFFLGFLCSSYLFRLVNTNSMCTERAAGHRRE
jgi:hypothetical protein